jgi:hypothetical protein
MKGGIMRKVLIILVIAFLYFSYAFADRAAPHDVPPLIHNGIKYIVPHWGGISNKRNQNGGYIEAWDIHTNKRLWELKIYTIKYDKKLEEDVQDIFINRIEIKNNKLLIWNEVNDKFIVDIDTKVIKPKNRIYKK